MEEGFYTPSEARGRLRLSKTEFYRKVNGGKIPKSQHGKYPKSVIDALALDMNSIFESQYQILNSPSTPQNQVREGFYTASQARNLLGLPRTKFYNRVNKQQIPKVTKPGYHHGFYPKSVIDAQREAINAAFHQKTSSEISIDQINEHFYTAKQAIDKLKLSRAAFYNRVNKQQIPKVTKPGYHHGFYPKSVIDVLSLEINAIFESPKEEN